MAHIDSMKVEFNLVIDNNNNNEDDIVNKPIVLDGKPIGVITKAKLDESGLYFNCEGSIWNLYINIEIFDDNKFSSIEIK